MTRREAAEFAEPLSSVPSMTGSLGTGRTAASSRQVTRLSWPTAHLDAFRRFRIALIDLSICTTPFGLSPTAITFVTIRLFTILSFTLATSGSPLRAEENLVLRSPENHLLVMHSGRVVKGKLTPRTGGYDVTLPAGRMFVSSEQIRFKAANLDDAYQRLRESFTELTPNTHIELARWCISNALVGPARRELLDALHLDPYHTEAKRMLAGIVREQSRATQSVQPASISIDPLAPERRSLGGLTQSMAATFTRNVQPLITNKCGNARCHGSGQDSFAVVTIRNGVSAYTTEQNLAAVLNQIDFKEPHRSALLVAATGLHGGSRNLLFRGQTGRRQLDLLKTWVHRVAQEVSPPTVLSATPSTSTNQTNPVNHSINQSPQHTSGFGTVLTGHDDQFVDDAVAATRHDPFDPDTFNQKFHGTRSENSTNSP